MSVRVRFAPSPTGYLHIGGARTALYNWLFARHNKGTFVLRIEDTDEVRSTPEAVHAILESMQWLGLDWDEGPVIQNGSLSSKGIYGPYFQMQRRNLYAQYGQELLDKKKAYYCYCSAEELAARREEAAKEGRPPKYDGRCRNLSQKEIEKYEAEGRKPVIRFLNDNAGQTKFKDIIKKEVVFENALLDDFIIVKSTGVPLYNFAVAVDDYTMKITHIIRGDDHISNTPRQIMIYNALGWALPVFAHIPMILGQDGGRLSKRHGATAVTAYRDEGYMHDAVVNYLALLGWATEDSQQLFEPDDLIKKFTLERCGSSPSIFDSQKLLWMNGEYIRSKKIDTFYKLALPFLKEAGLIDDLVSSEKEAYIKKVLSLEQEKIKLLTEIPKLVDFMLKDEIEWRENAVNKVLKKEGTLTILSDMSKKLSEMKNFTANDIEEIVRAYAAETGIKTGRIFHPLRVATSGRTEGPSLFHYMEVIGKDRVIARIEEAKKFCE
ncbi:MAG: glutamate--tRNA ligase [Elusimicrobiota bacterium]